LESLQLGELVEVDVLKGVLHAKEVVLVQKSIVGEYLLELRVLVQVIQIAIAEHAAQAIESRVAVALNGDAVHVHVQPVDRVEEVVVVQAAPVHV